MIVYYVRVYEDVEKKKEILQEFNLYNYKK